MGRMVADRAWVRMGATLFPGSGRTIGSLKSEVRQSGSVGRAEGMVAGVGKPGLRRKVGVGSRLRGFLTARCAVLDTAVSHGGQ